MVKPLRLDPSGRKPCPAEAGGTANSASHHALSRLPPYFAVCFGLSAQPTSTVGLVYSDTPR